MYLYYVGSDRSITIGVHCGHSFKESRLAKLFSQHTM